MYWSLDVKVKCPKCGKARMWDLQTHFMGYPGSCLHFYKIGEKIDELQGVSVILDGRIDDFIGDCPNCGKIFDLGAEIIKGMIARVFVLNNPKTKKNEN